MEETCCLISYKIYFPVSVWVFNKEPWEEKFFRWFPFTTNCCKASDTLAPSERFPNRGPLFSLSPCFFFFFNFESQEGEQSISFLFLQLQFLLLCLFCCLLLSFELAYIFWKTKLMKRWYSHHFLKAAIFLSQTQATLFDILQSHQRGWMLQWLTPRCSLGFTRERLVSLKHSFCIQNRHRRKENVIF